MPPADSIRILIVDDEQVVCDGIDALLRRFPGTGELAIKTSTRSDDAIRIVGSWRPDVVLVDIVMPEGTGIEFIGSVLAAGHHPKFVVISGHDDFQYVSDAYKLGATEYLLKPIRGEDLYRVMSAVIDTLDRERSESHSRAVESLFTLLRTRPDPDETEILRVMHAESEPHDRRRHAVALVRLAGRGGPAALIDTVGRARAVVERMRPSHRGSECDVAHDYDRTVLLLLSASATGDDRVSGYLKEFVSLLRHEVAYRFSIGTSAGTLEPSLIPVAYRRARLALEERFFHPPYTIISIERDGEALPLASTADTERFSSALLSGDYTLAIASVDALVGHAKERRDPRVLAELLSAIGGRVAAVSAAAPVRTLADFDGTEDLRVFVKDALARLSADYPRRERPRSTVELAMELIQEHHQSDIDLQWLADRVGVSYAYVSKLIKEKTGATFLEVVTRVRMEHALQLLDDPRHRIGDVAAMVGYSNPRRFTRVFKSHFGLSPEEYRRAHGSAPA